MFNAGKARCARTALLGLAFLPLFAVPVFATATLQIPDVNLPDGKVEFRPGPCDPTAAPASLPQQMPQILPRPIRSWSTLEMRPMAAMAISFIPSMCIQQR